jgi:threonine dehydratase
LSKVVRLRRLKETAIKTAIKHVKTVGVYSFATFNCAQQAHACLRIGVPVSAGGLVSGVIGHFVQPGASLDKLVVATPRGLFDYARSLTKDYG